MDSQELLSIIDRERSNSVGFMEGRLSFERRQSMEYYLGEPFGDEQIGQSQFVSRDVMETIEWMMPILMKMFMSTDEPVRFDPQGPEDVKGCQQATDYANYCFTRQNPGFIILYSLFKDALMQKNGFVKVYWEKYTDRTIEEYQNMSMDEIAMLIAANQTLGYDTEVLEKEDNEDGTISVKLAVTNIAGKVCIDPLPPEEVRFSKNAGQDLQKVRYVNHERNVTESELVEMGVTNIDDLGYGNGDDFNMERQARFRPDQDDAFLDDAPSDAVKEYYIVESYVLVDWDDDGIAERRQVFSCGNVILKDKDGAMNVEVDSVPIYTTTPIIMPHKLIGMSVADQVMDIQLLKSTIERQILNNLYLTNNPRKQVLDGMVNIDDLLTVRPGGVVRVKTFDAVKDLTVPFFGAPAFNMLGYIDAQRDNRTGVRAFMGVDPDVLQKNVAGVAIDKASQAAQIKIELIARVFAESLKGVFWAIVKNAQQYEKKSRIIRLRGEFVQVDPQEWSTKFDMTVNVGLGTGNNSEILQGAQLLAQAQQQMAMSPLFGRVVTEQNIYNLWHEVADKIFPKRADQFFTNPQGLPPPAPPPPDPKVELGKYKADLMDKTKRDLKAIDFLTQVKNMTIANQTTDGQNAIQIGQAMQESHQADAKRAHEMNLKAMETASQSTMQDKQIEHEADMKLAEMLMQKMEANMAQQNEQNRHTLETQKMLVETMSKIHEASIKNRELAMSMMEGDKAK